MAKLLPTLSRAKWLRDPKLQDLMHVIAKAGGEARVAGGAVRNALLGEPVTEVDLATTLPPMAVKSCCETAGFKVVPTGIDHGTLTVVVHGTPFEVTTLRHDIATDGRRAHVKFTDNWQQDAQRRDFTINAMFADQQGKIYDYTDGYEDIQKRKVRFVGAARQRIMEDYLRILRFFRFHARYGNSAPDAKGLAACKNLRKGLATLSAERIRQEMLKLLSAPRAVPTLKVMAKAGILRLVLVHTDDWRTLERLGPDAILRLAILAREPHTLKASFRLSNAEAGRIEALQDAPTLAPSLRPIERRQLLYGMGKHRWRDAVTVSWAKSSSSLDDRGWRALLNLPKSWQTPAFPITGKDLLQAGLPPGPAVGQALQDLEDWWLASGFKPTREQLLQKVTQ